MAESTPTPKNILRGHKAQVHAAAFVRQNERLATADAEGFVTLWDLTIMRPRAVWQPHQSAILGIKGWGRDKIITHGRDHKLIVWKINDEDEHRMSVALPLEGVTTPRPQPWMLHLLEVNTMNFCAFASCPSDTSKSGSCIDEEAEVLIAVPNTLKSDAIDIFSLPSQSRIHTITAGQDAGMPMSLALLNLKHCLTLISAFENGFASVHRLQPSGKWITTYRSQAHTQPILSLDVHPNLEFFLTSGADDALAKQPIPLSQQEVLPDFDPNNRVIEEIEDETPTDKQSSLSAQLKSSTQQVSGPKVSTQPFEHPIRTIHTKHSGQQGLRIRSDGRIFATSGWDSHVRVYSCKTMKELAVLQWHKVGCYAIAFAGVSPSIPTKVAGTQDPPTAEGLMSANSSAVIASRNNGGMSVKERRVHHAKTAHWIAAGAKDGKVSLWDIY